VTPPA
jgi:phosphohistidine phosphatase